ncbi:MAG: pitrilysin family protein [Candidatus Acidiferrales bacterium]
MRERKKELSRANCIAGPFMVRAAVALSILTAGWIPQTARAQAQDKGTALSQVQRLNRAPVSKDILRVQLPRPTVVKLSNGLTLVLEEDHKLPTVAFTMWIRPGQLADPDDLPGLASFTAGMLREGTEKRTSEQIANEVDSLGATLEASSRFGSSYTIVTASGLIVDASKILDLMSDVTLHPKFPADELAKFKQSEEAGLEQRLANPQFLATRQFKQVVYGDTPMAIASPTKESIAKVTGEDLKKFHDSHYLPGNTILGVTGDFKAAEMQNLIEKYFNVWSGGEEPQAKFAGDGTPRPSKITLVDRPGSVQTFIIAGDRTIRRTDPQYYELVVMNQVEGGGPQARLFLDLREEHSLTYGAYSRVNTEIYPGDWQAFSPVRTPVTGEAMDRFIYEFKKINNEPAPQSEIDEAHRAIIANFALSLEQPGQILNDWLTVEYFGLPVDYWDKYPDEIAAIDAAGVQASAKKFVDLDHAQWICVGDRKQIEDVLKKYGPLSVVDVTGKAEN